VFNNTFNNVRYNVEHGDQFYWCFNATFNNVSYSIEP
jgi:hypothetical protein